MVGWKEKIAIELLEIILEKTDFITNRSAVHGHCLLCI